MAHQTIESWFLRRNAVIASIVRGTLEELDPQYPTFSWKPTDFTIE